MQAQARIEAVLAHGSPHGGAGGWMSLLDEASIDRELRLLAGWERDRNRIVKTFVFDDFREAARFAGRVVDAALAIGLEPQIRICSNEVTLTVFTAGAATITPADLALAYRAQALTGDHYRLADLHGP